jgi:hypothetical protein
VLLDALGALADHRRAVILVGAQAIYLHTHGADIAVAEYTTDGTSRSIPLCLQMIPSSTH